MSWRPDSHFWRGPWPWVLAACALAGIALVQRLHHSEQVVDPRPLGGAAEIRALSERDDVNVLFVLIDTLRADHLGLYGYHRPTSPLLDILASEGLYFAHNMAASSWTKCSMASLWTGMHPQRAGITRFDHVLPDGAVLAPEIFRQAGFRTAGLWRNGWVEGYFGFDQGFEDYSRPGVRPIPEQIRRKNPTVSVAGTDLDLVDAATEFLRVHGHERWFLYLHMMDVHEYTYGIESAKFGTAPSDIYDNAILHTNRVLDVLIGKLYEQGLLHKTLIVIGSDHGEAFGERGHEGHARNVYPETTEVPLLVNFPFRLEQPVVVKRRTSNVDVWPTVLDLLGLPALEGSDGRSRVPEILAALEGTEAPAQDGFDIAHLDRTWGQRVETVAPHVAVREGPYRYLQQRNAEGGIEREELYDASRDTKELENLIATEPERAEALREAAEAYLASEPPWETNPTLELDEMQLNQLRALGYKVP